MKNKNSFFDICTTTLVCLFFSITLVISGYFGIKICMKILASDETIIQMEEDDQFFRVADEKLMNITIPNIRLPYKQTNMNAEIGILLSRDGTDYYNIDKRYIYALNKTGITNIRLISYDNIEEQIKNVSGIILVGGKFVYPRDWGESSSFDSEYKRFYAYRTLIKYADKNKIPLFGICAGYQMMVGVMNPKLAKLIDIDNIPLHEEHYLSKSGEQHKVYLRNWTRLKNLFGKEIEVNSIHHSGYTFSQLRKMKNIRVEAVAEDGVVESVVFKKHPNWIAVQFHPESLAAKGDDRMQTIFNLFVNDSIEFELNRRNLK